LKNISPQIGAQTTFLSSKADFAIYGGSAGSGKRLHIDTLIPTPSGFSRMGELKDGDRVFAVDGSLAKVVRAFPIELSNESYEVIFDSGEIIIADADHLWKTMTDQERTTAFRRTEEFRSRRKENRPSRSKEIKKNYGSSVSITRLNKDRKYEYLEPSTGSVRTTYEILETLKFRNNRINHSIELAKPIILPNNDLLVESYMLGYWLGDGYSGSGQICGLEEDIDEALSYIKAEVLSTSICTKNRNKPLKIVSFKGLTSYLRHENMFKNKHIPMIYLRGSIDQRIDLLRGIMDTDGTCDKNGKCTIAFSNERLINDTRHLLCSLGIKCTINEKKIKGYNSSFIINFTPNFYVFNLKRKRDRQGNALRSSRSERRYIVDIHKTEPCFMRCIEIDHPSRLYLVGETFIPTHNTYALLLEAARNINNPGYGAVIFRREQKMIVCEGGLRDTAMDIYPYLGGVYRSQPSPTFIFPSGAKITFGHLNQENEVLSWQGSQIPFIGYDELSHYSEFQFNYMMSRMRSTCGVVPYCRATTNPDSESWVATLLSWWIDQETGYPIKERSGIVRYFIRVNGQIMWADSKEELVARYDCDPNDPKSLTFISAKITDNPILMRKDPAYLSNLKALSKVERARLLDGNWKIRPAAGMYFPREDVIILDWPPKPGEIVKWVRSWDLAASEESDGHNPDWTVGMLLGRKQDGKIVVADVIRVRRKAAEVRSLVKTLAVKDGREVWISIPQDPGQAGRDQADSYKALLNGFTVLSRTITRNNTTMAEPAAELWQQGHIE